MSEQNRRKDRAAARRALRSEISRRLVVQYLFTLVGFGAALVFLFFGGWWVCGQFVWQPYDPLYQLLNWMKEYVLLWGGLVVLMGGLAISYYYLSKPLRYLDELVAASGELASPSERPIRLPSTMKNVEDELNLIRQEALRNAWAAREAEQRKNDLIVYLAHDLKTPLTSVIGYLTLLQDEPQVSPELRARYTGIALDKAQRLEELINEFFDITRFNLTSLELETCPVDLALMLRQVVSEFEPVLAEKRLSCRVEAPDKLEYDCDPDKMARVFDNLLRNACHYGFEGTQVRIMAQKQGDNLRLCFENEGKTIPPEKLGRIFEQFFRLDSSRGSRTGGAGLGLAIAKEIVELHGGQIWAESADDLVRFVVVLPGRPAVRKS